MLIILAVAAMSVFGKSREKHLLPPSRITNLQGGASLNPGAPLTGLLNLTDADAEEKASTLDELFGKVKKQDTSLKKYAKDNPQEIAELLKSWIKE
jgi:flagellar biosynthesis/type III secretory pathway M-ring protein FliF/YscJ